MYNVMIPITFLHMICQETLLSHMCRDYFSPHIAIYAPLSDNYFQTGAIISLKEAFTSETLELLNKRLSLYELVL